MILTFDNADRKIDQLNKQGHDVFWDGWTVVSFRQSEKAQYSAKYGVVRKGQFGYLKRFEVDQDGLWRLYGFDKK